MLNDRFLVVKIGGAGGIDLESACRDAAGLFAQGYRMVLAHGGSERANRLGVDLGYPPRFLRSPSGHVSRHTDSRTRDIFIQATNEINAEIVQALQLHGVNSIGLVDPEHCILQGERKCALRTVVGGRVRVIRDDYSGRIRGVDVSQLCMMLELGFTPVVPPLALSNEYGLLNVDGDRAAAAIAGALGAGQLILLSNVPGLLQHYPEESSLVTYVPREGLDQALALAQGRMKRKILSVQEALEQGVAQAIVADGRLQQPLRRALAGGGTRFD